MKHWVKIPLDKYSVLWLSDLQDELNIITYSIKNPAGKVIVNESRVITHVTSTGVFIGEIELPHSTFNYIRNLLINQHEYAE